VLVGASDPPEPAGKDAVRTLNKFLKILLAISRPVSKKSVAFFHWVFQFASQRSNSAPMICSCSRGQNTEPVSCSSCKTTPPAGSTACMTSPNPNRSRQTNTTACRERSTVRTNCAWSSSRSRWTQNTAGVLQLLLLLTAREDR